MNLFFSLDSIYWAIRNGTHSCALIFQFFSAIINSMQGVCSLLCYRNSSWTALFWSRARRAKIWHKIGKNHIMNLKLSNVTKWTLFTVHPSIESREFYYSTITNNLNVIMSYCYDDFFSFANCQLLIGCSSWSRILA